MNVIVKMDEEEDPYYSPPRRYEFADSPAKKSPGRRRMPRLSNKASKKILIESSRVVAAGSNLVSPAAAPGIDQRVYHSGVRMGSRGSDLDGSFGDVSQPSHYLLPGGSQSVVSDLTASSRRVYAPTAACPDRKCTGDADSKKTDATFMESIESMFNSFCDLFLDNDDDEGNQRKEEEGCGYTSLLTKEKRKNEAEEKFLGKIITCHGCHGCRIDVEEFGCGGW